MQLQSQVMDQSAIIARYERQISLYELGLSKAEVDAVMSEQAAVVPPPVPSSIQYDAIRALNGISIHSPLSGTPTTTYAAQIEFPPDLGRS